MYPGTPASTKVTIVVAAARWKNHIVATAAKRSPPARSHGASPIIPDTFGRIQYQSTRLETYTAHEATVTPTISAWAMAGACARGRSLALSTTTAAPMTATVRAARPATHRLWQRGHAGAGRRRLARPPTGSDRRKAP
jgi:hypothetical protein